MPLYAALVDPEETTFGPEHWVKDFDALKARIRHDEGDCALLSLEIRNPRVGLLLGKHWLWLSHYNVLTPWIVTPLFFGRIVGVPTNMLEDECTIEFDARPANFVAQKNYLADTLKVLPYFDPVFIDEKRRLDADPALETRSARWHTDRITHEVTISDVLVGEDGIEEFTDGDDPLHDAFDLQLTIGEAPLSRVRVDASVPWTQTSPPGQIYIGKNVFFTYTGGNIVSNWPKPGANMGGGWSAGEGTYARDVYNVANTQMVTVTTTWQNKEKEHISGDSLSHTISESFPNTSAPFLTFLLDWSGGGGFVDPFADPPVNIPAKSEANYMFVPLWQVETKLFVNYTIKNNRTERAVFDLTANLQPIVTLTVDEDGNPQDEEVIAINGANVGVAIGSEVPIEETARRSYFDTDRGRKSLEYLILLARARLRQKARCVTISFDVRFERAINLSCRKNARVRSPELPGGEALGKITSYEIIVDGDKGELIGKVTMACAVGRGEVVEAVEGDPTVFEADVVEPDVQRYDNTKFLLQSDDVTYELLDLIPNDNGLVYPLKRADVVIDEIISGSHVDQEAQLNDIVWGALSADPTDPQADINGQKEAAKARQALAEATLRLNATIYELRLKPVSGLNFQGYAPVTAGPLSVQKMIDLEAA